MDIKIKVGLKIKELRKSLGLTQEALAFKANMDKTYVNEVENGKRNISIVNLEKLIIALESSFESFFL
ncbi:helix-turn-helix domain-containing protein [Sphingobacterium faecale]|uniref:Helix-turn-helix transcriptional regulator n=1 Tax=Sphingobacterium faecale TaxID=2803775 RepID=A0ABS1QYV6_9SPHI|nr:helix-turn-helix transcriptional regulator [Sphingobacterium faecale]MBL1407612.1 helix-turn-helix transcriptional regulator [Sphingobacterium faecale]